MDGGCQRRAHNAAGNREGCRTRGSFASERYMSWKALTAYGWIKGAVRDPTVACAAKSCRGGHDWNWPLAASQNRHCRHCVATCPAERSRPSILRHWHARRRQRPECFGLHSQPQDTSRQSLATPMTSSASRQSECSRSDGRAL